MRVTYIGHATLLIEVSGVRILTDPNFDLRLGGFLRRVSRPGIALGALPKLDAILLTHAHADHLSFDSLNALPSDMPLYAPPAVSRWLNRLGYAHALPVAPGDAVEVGGVRIAAAAAKHLGARYAVDRWRSAANMYLLDAGELTCFFAGDTALTPDSHRMVEERLRARGRTLDLAMLPIGHAPWWKPGFRRGHLTSDDALELWHRLGARFFIPYHWGTFHHVSAGPYDAINVLRARLEAHQRRDEVKVLEPGEAFEVATG
jgi:L-ascorbate metabolism protein UlaG (beta-lactamase superfamily)